EGLVGAMAAVHRPGAPRAWGRPCARSMGIDATNPAPPREGKPADSRRIVVEDGVGRRSSALDRLVPGRGRSGRRASRWPEPGPRGGLATGPVGALYGRVAAAAPGTSW